MDTLARRKLSHYLARKTKGSSSITFTKDEPWALCFYMYILFMNKTNSRIIKTFDSAIRVFLSCCDMLGRTERLTEVLNTEVKNLERQGYLKKLKREITEDMIYENSDVYYYYEEDHQIDRIMTRFENADINVINLHRILHVSEKSIFSTIVNTVIFRNGKNYSLTSGLKMSKKVEQSVFSIEKTAFLMDQVCLSENEARFLLLKCRFNTIELLADIINSSCSCDNSFENRFADCLGLSEKDYRFMLRSDQKLKTFGFVEEDGSYDDSLNECIEVQSIDPWFCDLQKPLDCSDAYAPESFSVKKESREVASDLLNGTKPVSILFYGKPGSGKTELAKTLSGMTGKNVYIFKNEVETASRLNCLPRLACFLSMERADSVIIVDEADSVLKTLDFSFFGTEPTKTKGTINKMLENNRNKVIFIINHQQQIDESTLRRFTFSLKFDAMSASMLRQIAMTKLAPLSIDENTKHKLVEMFDTYRLTGASVDNVVKAVECMQCADENALLEKAGIVMKENSLLLYGKAKMRETVKKEYDPDVLNTDIKAATIIEMVQNATRFAEKNKSAESGIRMLFYGLSGTGKTELARYIAQKLGKPVLLKRCSDILNKYVGESEKNVCDAFSEAENSGAILLFDEADSFIYNRSNAQKSWERTLVNEFLTQMEEFSGILICTSNLRKILDPAMQRRFHMLVEFKPLNCSGIRNMAERYFTEYPLSDVQLEKLAAAGTVTPGDFGALASRIRFMNPDDITSEYIFGELLKLQDEKNRQWHDEGYAESRTIGFSA